ncbi:hypothetical protein B296_00040514 [Ensete ventricosum]|uniref:Uncharacterized protein n=1 Tax=Ensete ventricosum TaxID=4639 RepID=A0A426XFR6_ENSVE|nr:hypothetical protein B296_00040514 [Ensete ventricosum]
MIIVDRVGRHKLFIIGVLMFVTHLMVGGGVGGAARGSRRDKQRLHVHDLSVDMCVHRRLCVVLGAIGMAGRVRDTSTGDQIGRTKHGDSSGPFVGLHRWPELTCHALPCQVRWPVGTLGDIRFLLGKQFGVVSFEEGEDDSSECIKVPTLLRSKGGTRFLTRESDKFSVSSPNSLRLVKIGSWDARLSFYYQVRSQ